MGIRKSVKGVFFFLGRFIKSIFIFPFKFPLLIFGSIKRVTQSILKRENPLKGKHFDTAPTTIPSEKTSGPEVISHTEKNRNSNWKLDLDVLASSRYVGNVFIGNEGKLVFPKLSEIPGSYCFTFIKSPTETTIYIGETEQLRRRFQHYRTPGPSQTTNIRLNALMKDVILNNGEVRVDIITTALSGGNQLDLQDKVARLLVEQVWLLSVRAEGFRVENA